METPTTIKGFADLFANDSNVFTHIENTARSLFSNYGYAELRTPIVERTELFSRSIGTETDVVQKEMFTFPDRKGRSITLRPEATSGVMRAYIHAGLHKNEHTSKLFTTGPMFRYERPQKGRMRQFHQINCECLGAQEPSCDAEMIVMLMHFLTTLGITEVNLELNSLGCKECRPLYKEALDAFMSNIPRDELCPDCQRRIDTNPLRLLDCKVPRCKELTQGAPIIRDYLCSDCKEHDLKVRDFLDKAHVPYVQNDRLVRGLDYYVRTTFEVVSSNIGAQGSIAGGGRYDGLIAQLGGPDVSGIGFACGMERLALLLEKPATRKPDFFIAILDSAGLPMAFELAQTLRNAGLGGELSFSARSAKAQMRHANRIEAKQCCIIGGSEVETRTVVVKNMETGEQASVQFNDILSCF